MKVTSAERDPAERPERSAGQAKERSVVIPLDADAAMRALARFRYSGEGEPESYGTAGTSERE
jgi:hypothetical protein